MSKQSLFIFILILLLVLVGFAWYLKVDTEDLENFFNKKNVEQVAVPSSKTVTLPIDLDNSMVSSTKIHYNIFGNIRSIKAVTDGHEVILSNAGDIPTILIKEGVRISKITPPYDSTPIIAMSVKDLKVGMVVDVSMEYDLASESWSTLDVFVPSDRNK